MTDPRGCPVCEWDSEVAVANDYSHKYYTHVIIRDGETFTGGTCSMRTKPKRGGLLRWIR